MGYITIIKPNGIKYKIDRDDFARVSTCKWHQSAIGYIGGRAQGKKEKILMHRFITNAPDGLVVDHINGDKRDNRKSNLRFATKSANGMNRGRTKQNKSGYKGVSFDKSRGLYRAVIAGNGIKFKQIGRYATPEEAARAYNKAALELHGEFALLNEIPE